MKTQGTSRTLVEWVGFAIGASGALIALVVVSVVRRMFSAPKAPSKEAGRAAEQTPSAPLEIASTTVGSAGRDWSDYEAAITRCIQFPGIGYLLIWAYRSQSVVNRSVKLTDPALIKAIGAKAFPLKPLIWPGGAPLEYMENISIDDTEQFLAQKCAGVSPQAVRAVTVTEGEAQPGARAKASLAHKQAARVKPYAHGTDKPDVLESHVGVLEQAGMYSRTLGERSFEQFGVDIYKPELGAPKRVWGTDLERAITAADAKPGDHVRIDYTGSSKVALPEGGWTTMRHYVATVLEPKQ